MVDTLMYVKRLEAVGTPREQAETQVQIMAEVINSNLATKQDLKDLDVALRTDMKALGTELRKEMTELRTELRTEITELRTELRTEVTGLRHDMARLEDRLTIKLGTIMAVGIGALGAIIKFF